MVSEKEFPLSGKESGLSRGAATEGGGWDDSEDFVVAGSFFWKTENFLCMALYMAPPIQGCGTRPREPITCGVGT